MEQALVGIPEDEITKIQTTVDQGTQAATKLAVIEDAEQHGLALLYIQDTRKVERAVEDLFREPKKKAHEAHKAITAAEKKLLEPLRKTRKALTDAAGVYEDEQEAKAAAERKRLEEEARSREETDALEAAVEADTVDEGDAILDEAIAAPPPPVHVEPQTAKVAGVSPRKTWKAEVTDPVAFVKWVAEHPENIEMLSVNMTKLNGMARAMEKNLKIPGVRPYVDRSHTVR